ncbi:MAG: RING finger protein [Candidatus Thermoplasmatota archaeon]|nr:RING finger protein [Candidatus Thermoplasmatota archaeon]
MNIKSAAEVFNTAGILMKERNFKQVMELAAKSEAMADKSKTEFDLNNLLNAMENGFEQMKEKDDNLTDIGKDIERARELQKDGEMEKAHELAVDTEKNLRKILEPMVEERLNRLDSTIESSEKTIYVNEEKEERDLAKDAVDQGNFVEAFNLIATALRNLDQSKKNSYPLITLRFADMELKENVWNRAKVILKNTGKAHATGIKVELIGPVVVRRLKPISHLNAKEEKEVEIAVRFDGGGSVPVDVEMTYKSAVDGNEHETRDGLWIDVGPVAHKSNKPKHGPTGGEDRKGAPVIVPGKISRCKICLGVIKKPSMLYECGCGRKYHKSCITRVEECPSCSLPAQDM